MRGLGHNIKKKETFKKRGKKRLDPSTRYYSKRQKILEQKRYLPIASEKQGLLDAIRAFETLIIVGETGSGKSTQLPQFLYEAGFCEGGKMIGITQPRRVATVTLATRVAEEMGVQLGEEVGYSIRFEDSTSSFTRIKYMTDGMLLREALIDPLLLKYSTIIVDEAHERTIHTDVLLGLLKNMQAQRRVLEHPSDTNTQDTNTQDTTQTMSSLKILVMSATLNAQKFSNYFNGAKIVNIEGRHFPVDVFYTYEPVTDYLEVALHSILQIHLEEGPGDVLVFLTGQEEIETMDNWLHEWTPHIHAPTKILVVQMYAALPNEQQMEAFKPTSLGMRKKHP